MAYSSVSAVMKTTVSDGTCTNQFAGVVTPEIGKDLLEDCAENFDSPLLMTYECGGMKNTCEFLHFFVSDLLNESLGVWGKRYAFQAVLYESGQDPKNLFPPIESRGGCPRGRERDTSGPFPIKSDRGDIQSLLYVCD